MALTRWRLSSFPSGTVWTLVGFFFFFIRKLLKFSSFEDIIHPSIHPSFYPSGLHPFIHLYQNLNYLDRIIFSERSLRGSIASLMPQYSIFYSLFTCFLRCQPVSYSFTWMPMGLAPHWSVGLDDAVRLFINSLSFACRMLRKFSSLIPQNLPSYIFLLFIDTILNILPL